MLSSPWLARFAAIAALGASAGLLVQPVAQAAQAAHTTQAAHAMHAAHAGPASAHARLASAHVIRQDARTQAGAAPKAGRVRVAATRPAPLVADFAPARGTKTGLPAPAMSAAMTAANLSKQREVGAVLRSITAAARRVRKCRRLSCLDGLPAARNLAGTQQAQIRGYFCGPATLSEMLAQMGKKVSQVTAARELGTTVAGTDWSDTTGYPMPKALNRNQRKNAYVAVALPWSPSRAEVRTFEADLVTDVNHNGGVPLAGNAYEVPGGPHLAGNPVNQTIFHWIDIRGYQESGAVTDYEDSVHDASSVGWPAPAYSSMSSATMAEILGARGYIW
jgi:Peptidase_C39 like family